MRLRTQVFSWGLAIVATGAAILGAQSKFAEFGLNVNELKPQLVDSFTHGYIPAYPSRKAYYAASSAARVAFVRDTFAWVKAYTESAAFKADYDKRRAEAKPTGAGSKGTPDEQYAKYLADQRKALEEMKKNVSSMNADMQKQMQPVIQQMEASIEKTSKDPEAAAMMKNMFAQQATGDQERDKRDIANYEKEWPADPKVLIAARLHDFLNETSDLAFDAKMVDEGGGRKRFADEQFESKSDRWKLCYRAGKEPVDAARAFATDWLRQLEGK
jgi:predicted transcriptional regulator